jgi:hypothetical protein
MSFDESDDLERHSRQQHTTEINKEKTLTYSLKERVHRGQRRKEKEKDWKDSAGPRAKS